MHDYWAFCLDWCLDRGAASPCLTERGCVENQPQQRGQPHGGDDVHANTFGLMDIAAGHRPALRWRRQPPDTRERRRPGRWMTGGRAVDPGQRRQAQGSLAPNVGGIWVDNHVYSAGRNITQVRESQMGGVTLRYTCLGWVLRVSDWGLWPGLAAGWVVPWGPGLAALLRLGFTTAALRRRICGDGEWHGAHGCGWDGLSALMIFAVGT